VLVGDGNTRTALACVRSLIAAGHAVWAMAPQPHSLAGVSRRVREVIITEDPLAAPDRYVAAVARTVQALAIDVLLPVSDASVDAILAHRALLPATVAVPLPSLDVFRIGSDKVEMLALARRAGFVVPESVVLKNAAAVEPVLSDTEYPAILKPHRSVVTLAGGGCQKLEVVVVENRAALRAAVQALPPEAFPVLLQERIRGHAEGCFALRWDGTTIAAFAHRRLREKPPAGGVSVFRESIPLPESLATATTALLASLGWRGVAMAECKVDRNTGRHVFMELNGRLWGSLQLAIDAGVDFPALLVACAMRSQPRASSVGNARIAYTAGVRSRWFWGDVDHLYARLVKSPKQLHLEAPYPSRLRVIRDFLRASISRGSRGEIGRWRDPLPAVLESVRRLRPSIGWWRRPTPASAPSPARQRTLQRALTD
jgi:predicted ATP-grasp superfamily ATP-dependent carboligase